MFFKYPNLLLKFCPLTCIFSKHIFRHAYFMLNYSSCASMTETSNTLFERGISKDSIEVLQAVHTLMGGEVQEPKP